MIDEHQLNRTHDHRGCVFPVIIALALSTFTANAAPFNPTRYLVVTGTNFPTVNLGSSVALDGDHLLARHNSSGRNFVLQRHYGGADAWNLQAELLLPPGVSNSASFALCGDVAVVGNIVDDAAATNAGAVYIFLRNYPTADNWGYWKTVTAPGAQAEDQLGDIVATDGRYLAVSPSKHAPLRLFARNVGGPDNWGLVKEFLPTYTNQYRNASLDIEGDRLVVGESSAVGTGEVVRVFERNTGGSDNWGQVKLITPADGFTFNKFGNAVSLEGDWLAVGAYRDDDTGAAFDGAVYLFHRNTGGLDQWGQVAKLLPTASDQGEMGNTVHLHGDTLAATAPEEPGGRTNALHGGALYVFQRNEGGTNNWGRTARLLAGTNTVNLGGFSSSGVTLGDDVLVSSTVAFPGFTPFGGARVFQEYLCPQWSILKRVTPTSEISQRDFGFAVALDDTSLIGGRPGDSFSGVVDEGGVAFFERNEFGADNWGQILSIAASGFTNARKGASVSLHRQLMIVGAPGQNNSGTVELRSRGVSSWAGITIFSSPDALPGEQFGTSVGVWDDILVAGAPLNFGEASGAGAAFVYSRNQGGNNAWGLVKRLSASGLDGGANLGTAIAIYRDTVAVGAPNELDGSGGDGAVYLFRMNQGGSNQWGEVRKIKVPVVAGAQTFGSSVALWGDFLAVGDINDSESANGSGAVYVFVRNRGGMDNWGLVKKIKSASPEANATFGASVALRGDRLLVGEPLRNNIFSDEGRAYLYGRNTDGTDAWGLIERIDGPVSEAGAQFGFSVALAADRLAVGAPYEDSDFSTNANVGAVYIYQPTCLRITTTNDVVNAGDGLTSLREAINLANSATQSPFTVYIPDGEFRIASSSEEDVNFDGDFDITNKSHEIILQGQGARRTILNGQGVDRLLDLRPFTTGDVRDITIKNGHVPDGQDGILSNDGDDGLHGGGIRNYFGNWRIIGCAIVSNSAANGGNAQAGQGTQVGAGGWGGAVDTYGGTLIIRQSTISHNEAGNSGIGGDVANVGGFGGGISHVTGTTLSVLNSTIFGNSSGESSPSLDDGDGGGVWSVPEITIRHSTISHNNAGSGGNRGDGGGVFIGTPSTFNFSILNNNNGKNASPDGSGTFDDASYNLISNTNGITFSGSPISNIVGVTAQIGGAEVVNNGGQTDTMKPQPGSPVIDKGNASFGNPLANDQRGYLRPTNGISIDLGAVEATTDFDGDGIPDEWEQTHGGNFEEPADGPVDFDDDDATGYDEYVADTDPWDADEFFEMVLITTTNNKQVIFPSSSDRVYSLQTIVNLTNANWNTVSALQQIPGSGGLMTITHTNNADARAYRIEVEVP